MPTEGQYRSAATRFRQLSTAYGSDATFAPRTPSVQVVSAGLVADAIDFEHGTAIGALLTASDDLGRLASECERRADVCRSYRLAVQRWAEQLDTPMSEPGRRPVPPASWVDL
jgi:hypothetical protein